MRVAAQPDLYDAGGDVPRLRGTRCTACGRASFPPITIGCDSCGAPEDRLQSADLAATGLLHSIATVHRHHGQPPAPFTVAEVLLEDGPLVRAMVAPGSEGLRIGESVTGIWQVIRTDDAGNDVVEPAFMAAAQ